MNYQVSPSRPRVALITDPNDLAVSLIKRLIESFCEVDIFSEDPSFIKGKIPAQELLRIRLPRRSELAKKYDYVIYCDLNQGERKKKGKGKFSKQRLEFAIRQAKEALGNSLFIFPYVNTKQRKKRTIKLKELILKEVDRVAGIIYVGELIGPEMFLYKNESTAEMLRKVVEKGTIKISGKKALYPISIKSAALEVSKSLFSFGALNKELALIPNPVLQSEFTDILQRVRPKMVFKVVNKTPDRETIRVKDKNIIKEDLERIVYETLKYFSQAAKLQKKNTPVPIIKKKGVLLHRVLRQKKKAKIKTPRFKGQRIKRLTVKTFLIALLIILIPVFGIFTSVFTQRFAKFRLRSGDVGIAEKAFVVSYLSSQLSHSYMVAFSNVPIANRFFSAFIPTSNLLSASAKTGLRIASLAEKYSTFLERVRSEAVFDTNFFAKEISLELDYLYKELGFLQLEIESINGLTQLLFNELAGEIDIVDEREKVFYAKTIFNELPDLLGQKTPKTYLILFQDNTELRPTGGFISAFGLATFNKGRLVSFETRDVYWADSQLKGHVEPPDEVRVNLGIASWFLRDSNWDPSFPETATKAEWFLDKEIDVSVDGVIAVDLEFVKEVLKESGSLSLDSGTEVSYQNLYKGLFDDNPTKEKRAKFLKDVSENLIEKITNLAPPDTLRVTGAIIRGLDEKHVQVYLHNARAQKAISDAGWDGIVSGGDKGSTAGENSACSDNCEEDWLGLVETNITGEGDSSMIKREAELSVVFEEGVTKKRLIVKIDNPKDLSLRQRLYKAYLRVLAPSDSSFSPVVIIKSEEEEIYNPNIVEARGRKEAGIVFELETGESSSLVFSWENSTNLNFKKSGEYNLFWRKQAGTFSDPISAKFIIPTIAEGSRGKAAGLTQGQVLGYNTELSRDFVSRISW